ncbi:MAG: diphosphate--fructose-6-phosphate 1-phosphotransferase [Persicimonas sp.]
MTDQDSPKRLAVLASGGPAPGINSVISAVTIEALNQGWEVYGVRDGYRGLVDDELDELALREVAWIHFRGGAVLGMSRTNPAQGDNMERIVETLYGREIDYLVTIGGDDTAFGASVIAEKMGGQLRCAHVPKTIDNDLPLPPGVPTFGYTTARQVGVGMVKNLIEDAQTTGRWYNVVTMGRQAGHLALGIGKAAGAHITLIPEEFEPGQASMNRFASLIEGAVIKGRAHGRGWGVAVMAEGLIEILKASELEKFPDAGRDAFGHIRLANINLGSVLNDLLGQRLGARGIDTKFRDIKLGYELRCADPVPFDIEYTRDLGYAAVHFLAEGGSNAMVVLEDNRRRFVPFEQMRDPDTGRTKVRNVDVSSESYLVARRYMQRLTPKDFDDRADVERLAAAANTTPSEFVEEFGPLVSEDPEGFAWEDEVRDELLDEAGD